MNLTKSYCRLQDADGYRTKADELTTTGAELPGVAGKAVPFADEELIAEPEKESAVAEDEFEHSWVPRTSSGAPRPSILRRRRRSRHCVMVAVRCWT